MSRAPATIRSISRRYGAYPELIQNIPELSGKVLRRNSTIAFSAANLAISAAAYAGTAEEHFGRLREEGMAVPDFTFYLDEPTILPSWRTARRTRLYTVTDAIDGEAIPNHASDEYMLQPRIRPHLLRVADSLSNYYDWVERTQQPYFLWDVVARRQYMLGHNVCQPTAGESLHMVDLDPTLAETSRRGPEWPAWNSSMQELGRWAILAGE